ncbi:hypothetical protein KVH30_02340 [Streptomyces olivaceus]|nr:hypothetical protein [Streptomyces olivaceus]MBZ6324364.1 hypothetical protein [Streptomyces olivaceus]
MPKDIMTEDKWPKLRELHALGMGRNEISREMGITNSVISRTAAHIGLSFDRSKIRAAMDARKADLDERLSLIAEEFMAVAEDSLRRIHQPTTVYSFGGKDNVYEEHTFPEAPVAERVKLTTAAAIAVDKVKKLIPDGDNSGADDAKSMLGKLAQGIAELANQDRETPTQNGGDE